MKFTYGDLDPTHTNVVDQAWAEASYVLNPDTVGYSTAEGDFREAYQFAEHNGGYHFGGDKGEGVGLYGRVLLIHGMWKEETPTAPDSAARVLGFMAALNTQMNQGGNA